ncbi:hypothetical protein BOTBODRAFT_38921 [Botryobasidium botryosum FD-172 SS1]|uniref:Glycerol-3-phosphate dehydrogenase [NAD(+)] n=1 Tax=Botryobasidium botryosum (strain FD-172 SS1) TaxID=930990 RepID=A0A067LVE3_BOTB1|nr:hypothetical protein BOTBODRAFT_38921 [Botryobasidium botryosum FD-172 SS1]
MIRDKSSANGSADAGLERVAIIGSGNWGSAIARIAASNAKANPRQFHPEIIMWTHEEDFEGRPLTEVINSTHENPRYLPHVNIGENVRAEKDLGKAVANATALIFVTPHQFLEATLEELSGKIRDGVRAVTLIKGVKVEGSDMTTFASVISSRLNIPCSALCGANIAQEVAMDLFSESTLGIPTSSSGDLESLPEVKLWKTLFQTPKFRIRVVADVEGVCLGGGLKNIISLAAGFIDGLGWGANAKAAIMRTGFMELHDFCLEFFPSTTSSTFLQESCGFGDIIASCIGGRNRKVAEAMVKTGKNISELEDTLLDGQKLQGALTARDIHNFLHARRDSVKRPGGYPLFEAVWNICYNNMEPEKLIDNL